MHIVLITSCFPSLDIEFDDPRTRFLYYYAAEWVRQGHRLLILHSVPSYPRLFSEVINVLENRFNFRSLEIGRFKQHPDAIRAAVYEIDGIKVIRTPIDKLIPHRDFLARDLRAHRQIVLEQFDGACFKADLVISDFLTPSIYISDDIRKAYGTPFFQVIHDTDFHYLRAQPPIEKALRNCEGVLFRSFALARVFDKERRVTPYREFIFTGIPSDTRFGVNRSRVKNLVFVGQLVTRKKVDVLIKAISISKGKSHFRLEIVGDGAQEKQLRALVRRFGLNDQVAFTGRICREEVFARMERADCFIMVSRETYGMVYVEALSQGCIVVAAKGQGFDGIIVDGENGFLVEHDNVEALSDLLDQLLLMEEQEIQRISDNGLSTAQNMTDGRLARELIERLGSHLAGHQGQGFRPVRSPDQL